MNKNMIDRESEIRKKIKRCIRNYKLLKILVVVLYFIVITIILSGNLYQKDFFVCLIAPNIFLITYIQGRKICDGYIYNMILANQNIKLAQYYIEILKYLYKPNTFHYKIRLIEYHMIFTGELDMVTKYLEELEERCQSSKKRISRLNIVTLTSLKISYYSSINNEEKLLELTDFIQKKRHKDYRLIENWSVIYSSRVCEDYDKMKHYLDNVSCYNSISLLTKAYYLGVYYEAKEDEITANKYFKFILENSGDFYYYKDKIKICPSTVKSNIVYTDLDINLDCKIINFYKIYYRGEIIMSNIAAILVIFVLIFS